ncbi:MAG: hypothetical protein C4547_12090 [Phycisphaerales bacterium]|nr:MAG: hypothetical protein C4547_12090 [Phycisphaerales bacterium]
MLYPEIDVDEAKRRLDADPNTVFIDVRTEAEFEAGHVPNALNIPIKIDNPATGQRESNPDFLAVAAAAVPKDARVICGCKTGGRSGMATQLLLRAGYRDVTNMDGGFVGKPDAAGWSEQGYPISFDAEDGRAYRSLAARAGLGR